MLKHRPKRINWIEVSVLVSNDCWEIAANALTEASPNGIVVEENPKTILLRGYIPEDQESAVKELRKVLNGIDSNVQIRTQMVVEEDWAHAIREHFRRRRHGRRIVVTPSWDLEPTAPGDIVIQLDPGMAFGTGEHATTALCLESLEETVRPEDRVLDLGTGSGILAIAAAKAGAQSILATDNDPDALEVASANAERNGVSDRVRFAADITEEPEHSFDLVIANINRRTLEELLPSLTQWVKSAGRLIASGILVEEEDRFLAFLKNLGYRLEARHHRDEWTALLLKRT